MKLDFSDPERWSTLVEALKNYRQEGLDEGYHPEELHVVDEMLIELDENRTF